MQQENEEEKLNETIAEVGSESAEETQNIEAEEVIEVSEVDKLKSELAESKDKFIRLYSEFENFRRRTAKEKIEVIQNASEGLIKELLPVMDDFERAQKSIETTEDINAIKEGILLIFNKLQKTLQSKGLKPIEAKDQAFDVELHECITQFAAGDDKKGLVIDEVEKGYYLNDKVIRYSKVVVGN
ncbi:nucleotide exchange factor GrpE [Emticicia sp. CRIBPO]|uniref:nucleotide exchange factor GrpE n=1 Tax=Emticicia sp. CRIBPO TaxID=2683258 RepID=UPI001412DEF1|nr:nucleotide exchange factor GrpE [Emticicia sp. CRIBPO]NBA84231.1 nucleotide exchange factor GrpE [Emticicia sp. CRIBPO]